MFKILLCSNIIIFNLSMYSTTGNKIFLYGHPNNKINSSMFINVHIKGKIFTNRLM